MKFYNRGLLPLTSFLYFFFWQTNKLLLYLKKKTWLFALHICWHVILNHSPYHRNLVFLNFIQKFTLVNGTCTGFVMRYALLVAGLTSFCAQKCLNSAWHRCKKGARKIIQNFWLILTQKYHRAAADVSPAWISHFTTWLPHDYIMFEKPVWWWCEFCEMVCYSAMLCAE